MRCILRDEPLSLDPHPYTPHPLSLPAAEAAPFSAMVARLAQVEGGAVAWLARREDGALRRLTRAEVVTAAHPPPGYSGAASSRSASCDGHGGGSASARAYPAPTRVDPDPAAPRRRSGHQRLHGVDQATGGSTA